MADTERQEQRVKNGERLAQLRGPMSQKAIGARIGVSAQAVSNWERGVTNVDQEHLVALDEALDADGEVVALYALNRPARLVDDVAELRALVNQLIGELARLTVRVGEQGAAIERIRRRSGGRSTR